MLILAGNRKFAAYLMALGYKLTGTHWGKKGLYYHIDVGDHVAGDSAATALYEVYKTNGTAPAQAMVKALEQLRQLRARQRPAEHSKRPPTVSEVMDRMPKIEDGPEIFDPD